VNRTAGISLAVSGAKATPANRRFAYL